jgi:hypothetical protein
MLELVDTNVDQQMVHLHSIPSRTPLTVPLNVGKAMFDYAVLVLGVYLYLLRKG